MSEVIAVFVAVFLAELPDKTMLATLLMTARTRRPVHVWVGAVLAFGVQVTLAVAAGSLIKRLPETVVGIAVAVMFAVGGIAMLRGSAVDEEASPDGEQSAAALTARRVVGMAFGAILLAELGDLTQLTTAGMAARSDHALAVGFAAWLALAAVAGLAAFGGQALGARLPTRLIQRAAGVVFLALAVVAAITVIV